MAGELDPRYDKRGGGGGGGGGGLIMVGGLDPRYDSGSVHFRHNTKGGGSCLAEEGEVPCMKGQLYDLLNSERFTIDYNDFRNFNT